MLSNFLPRFTKLINCNYAIDIGKKLGFRIVNMEGNDFVQRNRKLILGMRKETPKFNLTNSSAFLWQACRYHMRNVLNLGKGISEKEEELQMVKWANEQVKKGGKKTSIKRLTDKTIGNGLFFIDLLDSIEPGVIDYDLVKEGKTVEERELNAKYVMGVARKIGCFVFSTWEDILEVRKNMVLAYLGSLRKYWKEKVEN